MNDETDPVKVPTDTVTGKDTTVDTNTKASRTPKLKMQFSKNMCIRSWWLMAFSVVFCICGEFFLQYTDRGSMGNVVTVVMALVSFVTVFINGGYITQNIFRDTSLNKYGLRVDEETKQKYYINRYDSLPYEITPIETVNIENISNLPDSSCIGGDGF